MKASDYWRGRFEQLEESLLKQGISTYDDIEKQYRTAMQDIEKDISVWYKRLAVNNDISYAEAQKMLNKNELKEFHWTVEEYIKKGKENSISQLWTKQLENASAKVHISRLEAMKLQMQQHLEVLYGNQLDSLDGAMRSLYSDGYYRNAYEVQKGLGVGYDLQKLDENKISKVISKPWANDGKNFSDRIWTSKDKLVSTLHTELTQAIIRGDSLDQVVCSISKTMNSSKSAAGRLVMTESAFFASASQKDCFSDLGVEQYEIVATLDMKTSSICRDMDGKMFKMNDFKPGITAPPFHCWCRSCTAPYFDDMKGTRAARGEDGKTYQVSSDIKYDDWKKVFVDKEMTYAKWRKSKNIDNPHEESYNKGIENTYRKAIEFGNRTGNEGLYWLDKKGDSAYPDLTGTQNQVVFTNDLVKFLKNASNDSLTCVHNHPSSSAFSDSDLDVMCRFKSIDCMRVIGHDGVEYYAKVGAGQRPNYNDIKKSYSEAVQSLRGYFEPKVLSGELEPNKAWKEHTHQVLEMLAKKYEWLYWRDLHEE